MYLDRRLWRFTRGVRGAIAAAALAGLLGAPAGIARLIERKAQSVRAAA